MKINVIIGMFVAVALLLVVAGCSSAAGSKHYVSDKSWYNGGYTATEVYDDIEGLTDLTWTFNGKFTNNENKSTGQFYMTAIVYDDYDVEIARANTRILNVGPGQTVPFKITIKDQDVIKYGKHWGIKPTF